MKDLYSECYKTAMKEIKDTSKWKDSPYSWIGRINIIKSSIPPNMIYKFNAVTIKNSNDIFHRNISRTNNPKMCMEPQKTLNSQSTLEKEEQS